MLRGRGDGEKVPTSHTPTPAQHRRRAQISPEALESEGQGVGHGLSWSHLGQRFSKASDH